MANQSVRLKEDQLRREEEKLREIEFKVQREIQVKRQELMAKEDSLKVLEARLGESRESRAGDFKAGRLPDHSATKHRDGLSPMMGPTTLLRFSLLVTSLALEVSGFSVSLSVPGCICGHEVLFLSAMQRLVWDRQ